jgi:acetoacetyl-CoA synthetase
VPGNHAGVIEEPGVYRAAAALDGQYGVEDASQVLSREHKGVARRT